MTRWHQDDLAGRILSSEDGDNWTVICLPAIWEKPRLPEQYQTFSDYQKDMRLQGVFIQNVDPIGRAEGEALHPGRYPVEALQAQKVTMGSWGFSALYQQLPMPSEGGLFQRDWFKVVDGISGDLLTNRHVRIIRYRYWDFAGTDEDGDYTAGVRMAKVVTPVETLYFVEDVIRGQWSSGKRNEIVLNAAKSDGQAVKIWIEQEPGSSGKDSVRSVINLLAGYTVRADKVSGSKEVRAGPMAAQAEAGFVRVVRGEWNAAFINEMAAFPAGSHDDQVDAASGAFNKVSLAVTKKADSYQG
jgi:predicted phage terminase large subunit-like protein